MKLSEFKVWRTIVDWVEDCGGAIFAACPPGSSVYDYKKCCLIDPISKKRDEPDILFALGNDLFIAECKPTLSGILNTGSEMNRKENDIEKLLRIKSIYMSQNYNQQLMDNYGINTYQYNLKLAIGYAEGKKESNYSNHEIVQFIVDSNMNIKKKGF